MELRVFSVLSPALSRDPMRDTVSSKVKPSCCTVGAALAVSVARSFMPTPVAWLTWKSRSIISDVWSNGTLNAWNDVESLLTSSFSPNRSPAAMTWDATVSSSVPVSPSRVFRSATVVPASWNVVGTVVATFWALFSSPSRAAPVAPVPTRIVSDIWLNSSPMS